MLDLFKICWNNCWFLGLWDNW